MSTTTNDAGSAYIRRRPKANLFRLARHLVVVSATGREGTLIAAGS